MRRAALALLLALLSSAGTGAHHGSSEYHVDRETSVTGTVASFRWVNPHIRIVLRVGTGAAATTLDCEGPPLDWAAGRGWSQTLLREGEPVTLVMYPAKQAGRGGLVKRIERAGGEVIPVSRPWLDGN